MTDGGRTISIGKMDPTIRGLWRLEREVARLTITMKQAEGTRVSEKSWLSRLPGREEAADRLGVPVESIMGVYRDEKGRILVSLSKTHVPTTWKFTDKEGTEARVHVGELENSQHLVFVEALNLNLGIDDEEANIALSYLVEKWLTTRKIPLNRLNIQNSHLGWVKSSRAGETLALGAWIVFRDNQPTYCVSESVTTTNEEEQEVEIGRTHTFGGLKPLDYAKLQAHEEERRVRQEEEKVTYQKLEEALYGARKRLNSKTNSTKPTTSAAGGTPPMNQSENDDEWTEEHETLIRKAAEQAQAKKRTNPPKSVPAGDESKHDDGEETASNAAIGGIQKALADAATRGVNSTTGKQNMNRASSSAQGPASATAPNAAATTATASSSTDVDAPVGSSSAAKQTGTPGKPPINLLNWAGVAATPPSGQATPAADTAKEGQTNQNAAAGGAKKPAKKR